MKKTNSLMEYITPMVEIQYEELTVLCTSTGVDTEEFIEDTPIIW